MYISNLSLEDENLPLDENGQRGRVCDNIETFIWSTAPEVNDNMQTKTLHTDELGLKVRLQDLSPYIEEVCECWYYKDSVHPMH